MSRYYDPVTHRFVNADGYFQSGEDILDANMSAYCGNNPINFYDPTGTKECPIHHEYWEPTCVICRPDYAKFLKKHYASSGLSKTADPNSSKTLYNPDGTPKQKRWYDNDGNAERVRDYNHSGNNLPFPHDHEWKNGTRGKDHLPPSPEYEFHIEPFAGAGLLALSAIGMAVIAIDDVTGVGAVDDCFLVPLAATAWESILMIVE